MKIKRNKTNITFTDVMNESILEDILHIAEISDCKTKREDYSTKVIVMGDLDKFTANWSKIFGL